jgi:hypothetical protein
MALQKVGAEPVKLITQYVVGTPRNVLLGASLAYALERKDHTHIPIILLFPSVYAGYHLYTHRNTIAEWVREKRRWRW